MMNRLSSRKGQGGALFISIYLFAIAGAIIYYGHAKGYWQISFVPIVFGAGLLFYMKIATDKNKAKIENIAKRLGLEICIPKSAEWGPGAKGVYDGKSVNVENFQLNPWLRSTNMHGLGINAVSLTVRIDSPAKLTIFNEFSKLRIKEEFTSLSEHKDKGKILEKLKDFEKDLLVTNGWVMVFYGNIAVLETNLADTEKIAKYLDLMIKIAEKLK